MINKESESLIIRQSRSDKARTAERKSSAIRATKKIESKFYNSSNIPQHNRERDGNPISTLPAYASSRIRDSPTCN